MQFKTLVENQTSQKIKAIVNDNGGEYTSSAFQTFLINHGIRMHLTAPYTPQQNPVAEVGNRTTVEKARAMLKHAGLPTKFWGEAVSTAVYLENRTPVASLQFRTPYELWHGTTPTYDHLRVFGCLAYVHVGKEHRSGKFSDTAVRGVHLGYQDSHHNYRIYLLDDRRIVYSHDVVFNEEVFPLQGDYARFTDSEELDFTHEENHSPTQNSTSPGVDPEGLSVSDPVNSPSSEVADSIVPSVIVEGADISDHDMPDSTSESSTENNELVSSLRPPHEINSSIDVSNILPTRTRRAAHMAESSARVTRPSDSDPQTYHQAISATNSQEWIEAMNKELSALEWMGVWEEVELPDGEHALGTTWVYKRKTNAENQLIKHKARLCAQGFSQVEGVDYSETYAPTGRLATLRTCLSICATEDFEVVQMDAVGAFLNGVPDEVLFIKPPKGYTCKKKGVNIVLKLKKSLYGLKQSPRCWYKQLKDFFTSINFKASSADPCFFISSEPGWKCGVYVHVDDLSIMGQNTKRFKTLISERFEMEDLGPCTYFLGMRIERNHEKRMITLYQDKYINVMLEEYGMHEC